MRRLFMLAALLFALPAHAVTIDWVTVGDPGNAADTTGYGAVAYTYQISKYETTNAQYAEFLDAVATSDTHNLYNVRMGSHEYPDYGGIERNGSPGSYTYTVLSGYGNMPVNYVSFWDALRFANWLHNGQPIGAQDSTTTEEGAYTITAQGIADESIVRNEGAITFITSLDEWYKAAYYAASTMSYNPYPFADGFNGAVCEAPAGTTSHSANCGGAVADLTDVGSYTDSASAHGTFDQGGNVVEWNESTNGVYRGLRAGSFGGQSYRLAASYGYGYYSTNEGGGIGFRVAMIPEPSTALLLAFGLAGLAAAGRRRALWPSVPWREMP